MYLTCNRVKYNDLKVICKDIFDTKYNIEFTNDDIKLANDIINDNDYKSFIDFINDKKPFIMDVDKKSFLGKIDNLLEFIVENAYELYTDDRIDFLSKISPYEKIAVQFSNLDSQILNNGLYGWDNNGYSDDLDDLEEFLKGSDFTHKNLFFNMFESFTTVKNAISKLDQYDDWYEEDLNTRWESLKYHDNMYNKIREEWMTYLQDNLLSNMPNDYVKKIKEYNQKIDI